MAAWEERRGSHDRVYVATSGDRGRRWSRAVVAAAGGGDQQWPAVAISRRGRVTVAWSDSSTGVTRVLFARSSGRRFTKPRPVDPTAAAQWKPALAQGTGDAVHAVWIDDRQRSAWLARLLAGEASVMLATQLRGNSNAKAKAGRSPAAGRRARRRSATC